MSHPAHRAPRAQTRRLVAVAAVAALAMLAAPPIARPAAAQAAPDPRNHQPNAWLVYAGEHAWSPRFALYAEAQYRRTDFATGPKQLLLRPGVTYRWTDRVAVTAGYAYVRTSPQGLFAEPIATPEHRAWEQLSVRTPVGRLGLTHRLRAEQRWLGDVAPAAAAAPARRIGWDYANRARYLLRATHPLHAGRTSDPGWYATAFDEAFVRYGAHGTGRAFDQNRGFVGLGHRWSSALRVEAGYLNQYDVPARGPAREISHTLQLYVASDARLW